MKSTFYTTAVAAMTASLANAISIPQMSPKTDIVKRAPSDLLIPADGLSTNCISIGFLPCEGEAPELCPRYSMSQITSKLSNNAKAGAYGWYAQITDKPFDGSQLLAVKNDIKKSGAVFVASVMPSINFNKITPEVAKQVASAMKKFTDDGIPVWLRFGHEMNYYAQSGVYHGTPADFVTAWKNIYNANCKGNPRVKCFWSPNRNDDGKQLPQYWPGKEYVDIVGIDCYPGKNEDPSKIDLFDKMYGNFYNTYSKANNLPFAIGETGADAARKEAWLKTLVSKQVKAKYPNYVSMSWFEFKKTENGGTTDFRIVMTDDKTLAQTQQTLFVGGNESCAKGGANSTTTKPEMSAVASGVKQTVGAP
ncbi:glycoside hydrolase family 26 protein [Periconia macrospinosa]|uniref:Glycoside hydrolase family 26 protein n=1 Tax=Periconia macrospinosa TaxID=97972 RepID=A0A2V1E8K2_9PLEO|nr:glycoside hydrolase family 26 protein [Periconia macrospinosa]